MKELAIKIHTILSNVKGIEVGHSGKTLDKGRLYIEYEDKPYIVRIEEIQEDIKVTDSDRAQYKQQPDNIIRGMKYIRYIEGMDTVVPYPSRLSQWGSGTEVLYICPECHADFRIYGNKQKCCHMCGKIIDWSNSPRYCSKEFLEIYNKLLDEYHSSNGKITYQDYETKRVELMYKFYKGELR